MPFDSSPVSIDILPYPEDVSKLFIRIKQLSKPVWLDSGYQNSHKKSIRGRYDILSADPVEVLSNPSYQDIELAVKKLESPSYTHSPANFSQNSRKKNKTENVLNNKLVNSLPFIGGAIGYFNYEHNASDYDLTTKESFKEKLPDSFDSYTGIFDWALIIDHIVKKSYLVYLDHCNEARRKKYRVLLKNQNNKELDISKMLVEKFEASNVKNDITKTEYGSALKKIQKFILDGDVYQINFAQRFSAQFSGSKAACYLSLRKVLPSPYSAYIDLSKESILCFSPERFIDIKNGIATTKPIKGTAPRGKTLEQDKILAKELTLSEKNLAENLMIVDLLRNDFSRLCKPHSVKTPKLFALESFINVHHLVSTVTGELKENVSPLQLLNSCFPGGSITGAPKKRAMEIIQSLESVPRNIYCGTIFYLDVRGRLDSNITIRTLLAREGQIYCWGGGGIVYDSDIKEEYEETFHKVSILLEALKNSKNG